MHGTFELALDAQGRLHLPLSHREEIKKATVEGEPATLRAYVSGRGLVILTSEYSFNQKYERLVAEGFNDESVQVLRHFAQSEKCKLDKQGRIRLTVLLSKLSSIVAEDKVVVTGGPGKIHIWSIERFKALGLDQPEEVDP